jgi:uncharacterized membrane protein
VIAPRERAGVSALALGITVAALLWLLLIVTAPLGLVTGRARLLAVGAYEIGSLVCHQRPERSFHLAGIQMPVCARCFGLYLAGAVGLVVAWIVRWRVSGSAASVVLAVTAVPIAVTVALEFIGLITTSNMLRMFTGLPLGFAAGLVIVGTLTTGNSAMIAER